MCRYRYTGAFDDVFNTLFAGFAHAQGLLGPKHVAYTIFPQGLYSDGQDAAHVFRAYNRPNGMYDRLHRKTHDWGTNFQRMTQYEGRDGPVNQLDNIISAIRGRANLSKVAYTVVIQHPGGETIRPLGGPCLNYLAIQAEPGVRRQIGLLAVYRTKPMRHVLLQERGGKDMRNKAILYKNKTIADADVADSAGKQSGDAGSTVQGH